MADKYIKKAGVGFLIDASAKTYETVEKQIREFISNSLDAGANNVKIEVKTDEDLIIITDNGCGMTEEEFDENYLVIGCSQKYGDKDTIGRIGVGKFSAIPLCDNLTIRTRKRNEKKVYMASLDLYQLKRAENRTKDITKLTIGTGSYVNPLVDDPDTGFTPEGNFTRMILRGIPSDVKGMFSNQETFLKMLSNLGRILPFQYSENSKAIIKTSQIDPELSDELIGISKEKNVRVVFHTPEYPQGKELYRSLFGDDYEVAGEEICGDVYPIKSPDDTSPAPIRIVGYFADMSKGLTKYSDWKGINVRVQNTTVLENAFFNFRDAPAQARMTGEIQLLNVNEEELITMNRSGFVNNYSQYIVISDWLTDKLEDFARRYVRRRTNFNSAMKKKSNQLYNQSVVATSMERAIREVFEEENVDISLLSKGVLKKEDEINQEEALLEEFPNEIQEIVPVPETMSDEIVADAVGGKFTVRVPENFLQYKLTLGDAEYEVKYVSHHEEEPIIDVDVGNRVIRVNTNSPPVKNGKHSLVLAIILLEYAFAAYPDDVEMLKKKAFEALMSAFKN